ncbi:hypothetical protein SERMPA_00102 (plasmid) [Serratia marcescens]|jgi:muramidase (phage lysozyme)|nr:glycoside hydrolase family 104 protein [Serratia marcescens]CAI1999228.1 Phage lysozyme [Serratia marcescens]
MPYIDINQSGDINLCAFLDMIAWSEGTEATVHPLTGMDGYDVIVTGSSGPEIFYDFSTHPFGNGRPPKHVTGSLYSSASGRYQFLGTHWVHYRDQLNLPDFGPLSQDLWAIQLIRERNALTDIRQHRIREAIFRCANIWASFPGAGYGQPEHRLDQLIMVFESALHKLQFPPKMPDENITAPSESIDILTELRVLKDETMKIRCLLEAHLGLVEKKQKL